MRLFAFVLLGFHGFTAFAAADGHANVNAPGASFLAPRGQARLALDAKLEKATVTRGKTTYTIDVGADRGQNGDFHVSDDGRSVLYLRKRSFLGRMLDDPRAQGLKPEALEGLALWRDGKLVATRTWEGLLVRRQMFGRSVSHVHWVRSQDIDWKKNELTLVTTSFRRVRLSLVDGIVLEESDLPAFTAAPRIAYGPVRASGGNETLEVLHWDKGTGPTKVRVRREAGSPELDRDAFWIVPEPDGGVATVREFVDEGGDRTAAKSAGVPLRADAQRYFAVLFHGTVAALVGDEVEFRRGTAKDGLLRVDVRQPVGKAGKIYDATLFVPVPLPEKKDEAFTRLGAEALLFEDGRWSKARLQSDVTSAGKNLEGSLLFRSPAREELVDVPLVANPYADVEATDDLEQSMGPMVKSPAGLARFRFARRP